MSFNEQSVLNSSSLHRAYKKMSSRIASFNVANARQSLPIVARNISGAAAVEFALLAPALIVIGIGSVVFGLVLNNYVVVTNAAAVGAKTLVLGRGSNSPYSSTIAAIQAAAPGLTAGNLTVQTTVNGSTCSSDSDCKAALTNAAAMPASVSVSYPCTLIVLSHDYAPNGCTLRQTTAGRIQ